MDNRNTLMTHAYYLVSEGIMLYLIALPVTFYYYKEVSWWGYFSIVLGVCFVFSIAAKITRSHLPYVLLTPVVAGVFYSIGYPLGVSIAFAGVLAWRYIALRSKVFLNYEAGYLIGTILLTLIGLFLAKDISLILIPLVQIVVIMVGHTLSHLVQIKAEERKNFNRTVWLTWFASFSAVGLLVYLMSDTLTAFGNWIWNVMGSAISYFITAIVKAFDFLNWNQFIANNSTGTYQDSEIEIQQEDLIMPEMEQSDGNLNAFIFIIIGILVLLFIFAIYKAMKYKARKNSLADSENFTKSEEKLPVRKQYKQTRKRRRLKFDHPVRKLMYQFERKAAKLEMGRLQHESIEDWFNRVGIEGNTDSYQKVRYGQKEITTSEQEQIKSTLNQLERELSSSKESNLQMD